MTAPNHSPSAGYSPSIDMTLQVGHSRFPVAEVGPDYLVVESVHAMRPTQGTLIVTIDGIPALRGVSLPEGLNPDLPQQRFVVVQTTAPTVRVGAG